MSKCKRKKRKRRRKRSNEATSFSKFADSERPDVNEYEVWFGVRKLKQKTDCFSCRFVYLSLTSISYYIWHFFIWWPISCSFVLKKNVLCSKYFCDHFLFRLEFQLSVFSLLFHFFSLIVRSFLLNLEVKVHDLRHSLPLFNISSSFHHFLIYKKNTLHLNCLYSFSSSFPFKPFRHSLPSSLRGTWNILPVVGCDQDWTPSDAADTFHHKSHAWDTMER